MAETQTSSLKQRVFGSGSWALSGHVFSQALRFGGNLVLTRLLFPEAFGLMTLVTALMVGATMMTDIGIAPGVVRDPRGGEPDFLRTAWVLQIAHGSLVALAMCALAVPAAAYFKQPELTQLILAVALVPFLTGFSSIKLVLALRNVQTKSLVAIDIGVQIATLVLMAGFAWWLASAWALVWGNVLGTLIRVIASHCVLKGERDRFKFDPAAVRSLLHFGGWVTLSSILTFSAGEGSKLVAGSMLSLKTIALFGIANGLGGLLMQAIHTIVSRSLFPAYAEVVRLGDMHRLKRMVFRARLVQVSAGVAVSVLFVLLGPWLVHFLYDDRYVDAGPILQIVAIGQMMGLMVASYTGVLWALSKIGLSSLLLGVQTLVTWICMAIGNAWWGEMGVIWGVAASNLMVYPIHSIAYKRLGLYEWRIDVPVLLISAGTVAYLTQVLWT